MNKYIVTGGNRLEGEVVTSKAKNCVLALLAASVLTKEEVIITDCPKIADVMSMIEILKSLGVVVTWQQNSIVINSEFIYSGEIPASFAKSTRSSIFLVGSLLARLGQAQAVFPGGCDIGLRPIDLHLKGLRALGARIDEYGGSIYCNATRLVGASVYLDFPSVGATENILLASVLAKGETTINNAAREPEIVSLAELLVKMGAKIDGAGSSVIRIEGVKKLHGSIYTPIPDRVVAGTYLLASAISGGDVTVLECNPKHLRALLGKIEGACGTVTEGENWIRLKAKARCASVKSIETLPYPGFPTDLQPQILALQTISQGASLIVENMFETRYRHVGELIKMGADIVVREKMALVRGVNAIRGAQVYAHDLRGGAALVIAGLGAEGITTICDVYHIERGYYNLCSCLSHLGAQIVATE